MINSLTKTSFRNNTVQNNNRNKKYRNKGFMRAQMATMPLKLATTAISCPLLKGMQKVSNLSHEDSVTLVKAAQEGLEQTGLKEKGVRTFTLKYINCDFLKIMRGNYNEIRKLFSETKKDKKAINAIKEELNNNKQFTKILKKSSLNKYLSESDMLDIAAKSVAQMFKTGSNAAYLQNANKIILPDKVLQTSVFHEMGHALNNNGGKILKYLQMARPLANKLPGIILTASLLNKRKTTDKPSDNKAEKVLDGVKKNAGKLTVLAMLPMVLEEGIASIRGDKIARNLVKDGKLTKELLKKVRLTNAAGFCSYTLLLATTALSTKLAIKVKDGIQEKYELKKQHKEEIKAQKLEEKNLKNIKNK